MTKGRLITGLTFLIMGIIVIVIGIAAVFNTDMSKYDSERENSIQDYNADGVKVIDLDLGVSRYDIVFDENTDRIVIDSKNIYKNSASSSVKDGKFSYSVNDPGSVGVGWFKFHLFDFDFGRLTNVHSFSDLGKLFNEDEDSLVTITLPAREYDKIEINAGVGNTKISGASSKDFKLSGGVGNLTLENVSADKSKLDLGVGNTNGTGLSLYDTKIDSGVGNVSLNGFIGDAKINCGVGNVMLTIKGSAKDYDIDSDEAGIHGSGSESSGKSYKIDIDSGLGECNIFFE